jgi:hypothetical protein
MQRSFQRQPLQLTIPGRHFIGERQPSFLLLMPQPVIVTIAVTPVTSSGSRRRLDCSLNSEAVVIRQQHLSV